MWGEEPSQAPLPCLTSRAGVFSQGGPSPYPPQSYLGCVLKCRFPGPLPNLEHETLDSTVYPVTQVILRDTKVPETPGQHVPLHG